MSDRLTPPQVDVAKLKRIAMVAKHYRELEEAEPPSDDLARSFYYLRIMDAREELDALIASLDGVAFQ